MRWILCAVVAVLCAIVALVVAAETRIGPIIIQLSPNHGIHTGDVLAVMAAIALISMFTLAIWRSGDRGRSSSVSMGRREGVAADDLDRQG
ncbi:MAG TPA: hypothetical protein VIY72_10535 [Acidimicrobiales bacterium]